jgi:hypothetical protein
MITKVQDRYSFIKDSNQIFGETLLFYCRGVTSHLYPAIFKREIYLN